MMVLIAQDNAFGTFESDIASGPGERAANHAALLVAAGRIGVFLTRHDHITTHRHLRDCPKRVRKRKAQAARAWYQPSAVSCERCGQLS